MRNSSRWLGVALAALLLAGCISPKTMKEESIRSFGEAVLQNALAFPIPPGSRIDSIRVADTSKTVNIHFNREFSYIPFRENNVRTIYAGVQQFFQDAFPDHTFSVRTLREPIERLIPNYYRQSPNDIDLGRVPKNRAQRPLPLIQRISRPYVPDKGLLNRNIVLWHSHGWYYNNVVGRWEWQRPRLFQSVEDLGPLSFTIPYLIPMLENAGATVFVPRERDYQTNEVVVDNDSPGSGYEEAAGRGIFQWRTGNGSGFARVTPTLPVNMNPFAQGSYRVTTSSGSPSATIRWVPTIPVTGYYGVYVSWAATDSNVTDATYVVSHAGGSTTYTVNQQIGGGTWQYLGQFKFFAGANADSGSVRLTNQSATPERLITADAVRFGGGMGLVERGGATSGRPKFMEGARYYLQYAGMPDTLVYSLNKNENEYKDDYQSRGEYVNYLYGAPFGTNKDRSAKGLGIPIDISLAFHTDAGITRNDTTIGTLAIYSIEGFDSARVFPDSISRLANRDLSDIMQTQIVADVRAKHDPVWNRRQLRDADYSEAVRPNVPAVLLELLSHQNHLDMKFMLDPQFRFDVSRAIYKSMLRFLSVPENPGYRVQPLPITHFHASLDSTGTVELRWRPAEDPTEPTAAPDRYIVYTRIGDGGFDNGQVVAEPVFTLRNIPSGVVYSFRISAVNAGGESFPSEILSVGRHPNGRFPALIVSGFDRVSGPKTIDTPSYAGFLPTADAGVPDKIDLNYTGPQYDFDPGSTFRSNDSPGYGASFADDETQIFAGNTFDYPRVHGLALLHNGVSFTSCSDEAVMDSLVDLAGYRFVDLILGEERETPRVRRSLDSLFGPQFQAFPPKLRQELTRYCRAGGNLLVSGSYIGTDLFSRRPIDSAGVQFAMETLKYAWVTDHAARKGIVESASDEFLPRTTPVLFNTELRPDIYAVEAPDALAPQKGGVVLMRYAENQFSGVVGYKKEYGVVAFGFPFETILGATDRDTVMEAVLKYLKQ